MVICRVNYITFNGSDICDYQGVCVTTSSNIDCVIYVGSVSMAGYYDIAEQLEQRADKSATQTYFIPITTGGDPNAAYRIGRALGHHYPDGVKIGIPSMCKSAGTLMCVAGSELIIADRGELGPLDIQISNKEELLESSSGLDIMQAVTALQNTMNSAFTSYLYDLKFNVRLGTRIASQIASKMAIGLVKPIACQIDPIKLGEHSRAMHIAIAYGERLNKKFKNTTKENIDKLLVSYPVHGFVIDRKEASELFNRVRSPSSEESIVFDKVVSAFLPNYSLEPARKRNATCTVMSFNDWLSGINESASTELLNEQQNNGESDVTNRKAAKSKSGRPRVNKKK